jgi:hypothetical protein
MLGGFDAQRATAFALTYEHQRFRQLDVQIDKRAAGFGLRRELRALEELHRAVEGQVTATEPRRGACALDSSFGLDERKRAQQMPSDRLLAGHRCSLRTIEHVCRLRVKQRALGRLEAFVRALPEERVPEDQTVALGQLDDAGGARNAQPVFELRSRHPRQSGQCAERGLTAKHGGHFEEALGVGLQLLEAFCEQTTDALGDPIGRRAGPHHPQNLANEQRISAAHLLDTGDQLRVKGLEALHHGAHRRGVESSQGQNSAFPGHSGEQGVRIRAQWGLVAAAGPHHQDRQGAERAGNEEQGRERALIGSVEVVEDDQ